MSATLPDPLGSVPVSNAVAATSESAPKAAVADEPHMGAISTPADYHTILPRIGAFTPAKNTGAGAWTFVLVAGGGLISLTIINLANPVQLSIALSVIFSSVIFSEVADRCMHCYQGNDNAGQPKGRVDYPPVQQYVPAHFIDDDNRHLPPAQAAAAGTQPLDIPKNDDGANADNELNGTPDSQSEPFADLENSGNTSNNREAEASKQKAAADAVSNPVEQPPGNPTNRLTQHSPPKDPAVASNNQSTDVNSDELP